MKIIKKYLNSFLYQLIIIFLFNSCLEDIIDPLSLKFDNSSDLITYVETRTAILNGEDMPLVVDVDELNQNLNSYLIIDIRAESMFESGHIPGAVNVHKSALLEYVKNIDTFESDKIIIVSNTGQVASYVTCLLIIAGYTNVYPLDRGMTYWNSAFSDELSNARGDGKYYFTYRGMPDIKPPKSNTTPSVTYTQSPANMEEKLSDRILNLLKIDDNLLSISADEFSSVYNTKKREYDGYFVIYALPDSAFHLFGPVLGVRVIYGPQSMIFYETPWTFKSSNFLLTLPVDNNILLYSPNGQRASFYQAYLHFIGHETAKTIKYGAISILDKEFSDIEYVYDDKTGDLIEIIYHPTYLTPYGFWEDKIRNYSFETGP